MVFRLTKKLSLIRVNSNQHGKPDMNLITNHILHDNLAIACDLDIY